MMDLTVLAALFDVLAPVVLIVLVGYLLQQNTAQIDTAGMSRLVMMVGTPSLVFSTLTTSDLPTATLMQISLGALCVSALAGGLALGALRLLRYDIRTFLPPLTMPNSGNLGLPLVLLAFGEAGLAKGVAFYFVVALIQYTVMPIVVVGRFSAKTVLREPLIWGVLAALLFRFTSAEVPQVVGSTTKILGGMMIPVMLILLGAAIGRLGLNDLKTATILAFVRLIIGVLAGAATVVLLGARGEAAGVLFLLAAMPSAIVTYVIAERHARHAEKVAGLVVMSTVVTLIVLPVLLWIALWVAEF